MCVYKPVDIIIAVSQSLWVLAMSVYKPVDIINAVSQSMLVFAVSHCGCWQCLCTNLATLSLQSVSQSLWVLAMSVYKPVDIVMAVSQSLWV